MPLASAHGRTAQAAHRHPDLPRGAGGRLLLRRQDRYIERLLKDGKHYFLSRPRRFGKSLFLDTLKELFEGSEDRPAKPVHAFYASIPYECYTNNDIANNEGFYASVFYSYFAAPGLDVAVEESTSSGRLDMAVRFEGRAVYVFEFKVVEQAGEGGAMAQLVERRYAEKHRAPGVAVHLVGVEFSSGSRNIVAFEHAAA